MTLDFGLGRPVSWKFKVADVPYAIIGTNFLLHLHYGTVVTALYMHWIARSGSPKIITTD